MDNKNPLTDNGQVDTAKERKSPAVAPVHKAVKKKSTITKLVLIGIVMVIGAIFAFVPMRFEIGRAHV